MADSEVIITGDVTEASKALASLEKDAEDTAAAVDTIATAFDGVEQEAEAAADATELLARAIDDLGDELAKTVEATAGLAMQRNEEAEALEHQVAILRAAGGEQAQINALIDEASSKRIEGALLADKEGDAVRLARKQELELTRRVAAARDAAQREAKASAQQELELTRRVAAAHEAAQREAEASARKIERFYEEADAAAHRYERTIKDATQQTKRLEVAADGVRMSWKAAASVAGSIGSVVSGIESAINIARQAADAADALSERTIKAQNLAATLAFPIDAAAAATGGFIEKTELAALANKSFALGVSESSEDFAELAAGISAIARKSGGDVTKLMEQAVEAVGKGSVERLDNVLVLIDQAEAEAEYADTLGLTVDQLSELQRATAIREVALSRIKAQADQTAKSVGGMAAEWKAGRVDINDYIDATLGFKQTAATVREALRGISEEDLTRFENFGGIASEGTEIAGDFRKAAEEWGISLEDVRTAAEEVGVSYEEMFQQARGEQATKEAREQEAILQAQAMDLRRQAGEQEHIAQLLQVQEADYSAISFSIQESIRLRIRAADAEGSVGEKVALTNQLQLEQAKAAQAEANKGRGGRRRDPNEALDRETAAILEQLAARREIREEELAFVGTLEMRTARQFELIELQREELRVRQENAEIRKVRGADERAERESELLEVATQRRVLDLQVQQLVRDEEQELAEQRISELERQIEVAEALGVATQILEQQRAQASAAFVDQFGTEEEARQVAHEQELVRIAESQQAEVEIAQRELDEFNRNTELLAARGQQVEDLALTRLQLEAQLATAEGDADGRREALHQREVKRIQNRIAAQKKAVSQTSSFLQQGGQFATLITNAAIKDDEKREKAALRLRGVESLAIGGLEIVKGVAAAAGFSYVEAGLHFGAAALAFTQGGLMIAGNTPGQGGASGGGGGGGGGGAQRQIDTGVQEQRGLATTPPSAEELTRIRGGGVVAEAETESQAGGVVVQIGTLVTPNSGNLFKEIDSEEVRKWGAA